MKNPLLEGRGFFISLGCLVFELLVLVLFWGF